MNGWIKDYVKRNATLFSSIYCLFMNNRVSGRRGNYMIKRNLFTKGSRILFKGKSNKVSLGGLEPSTSSNCHINIYGSNNLVIIEEGVGLKDLTIYVGGDNNQVYIKKKTMIAGKTELAVMEGTKIVVGEGSLFSANITFRAGDSHSVLDSETGERINPSKDIIVGNHVWVGNTVIVTKGTTIGSNSVVATGSVLTGKEFPENCAIGGNPAKVIKLGINWKA